MYLKSAFLILCATYLVSCQNVENEFINVINELDNEKSLYLFGGLSIEKVEGARSLKPEPKTGLIEDVVDRADRYLETHQLKFDSNAEETETGRSDRARGPRTRKLKKIFLPLLLALKMKFAFVIKLMMLAIKIISLKGLAAAFLALLLSGASFLKDMISQKKDHVTTAYITGAPVHADIVHSDWHRSGQAAAQELAYNYHVPAGVY